jgi:hypothetical protein
VQTLEIRGHYAPVDALTSGESRQWMVHVGHLLLRFAKLRGIPTHELASAYREIKQATGEANPALENPLGQLAPIA